MPDISPPEFCIGQERKKPKGLPRGKPFTKGDPRCKGGGRPKSFDQFRAIAQAIAQKTIKDQKTGEELTLAEALLRKCAASDEPALVKLFIEYAFGKVPDKTELSGSLQTSAPVITVICDPKPEFHQVGPDHEKMMRRNPAFEPSQQ